VAPPVSVGLGSVSFEGLAEKQFQVAVGQKRARDMVNSVPFSSPVEARKVVHLQRANLAAPVGAESALVGESFNGNFSATDAPAVVRPKRGRPKKSGPPVVNSSARMCTRSQSNLDVFKVAPVPGVSARAKKRSKKSTLTVPQDNLVHSDVAEAVVVGKGVASAGEVMGKTSGESCVGAKTVLDAGGEGSSFNAAPAMGAGSSITPPTPVKTLQNIGDILGIDPEELTEAKLVAAPSDLPTNKTGLNDD
jgi:hypothetical protein